MSCKKLSESMLFFAQEKRFFFLLMSIDLLSKSFTTSVELSLDTEKISLNPQYSKTDEPILF